MCACVSCRFWFLQWFRIVVVFLLGLYASARMTACCACLGVGFIVIPFFCFFAHACACTCGAVDILDRNVVFSCGASNIFNHFARVRVARCTFWIVTWCFLVVPAAAAFQSFCVCVCLCMWQCAHFGS